MESSRSPKMIKNNILVLGKTGVGKTSLINYLFGLKLPVGAGLPVTGRGLHEYRADFGQLEFHVYDSWGIEADRLSSWQRDLLREIARRNQSPVIEDWFHAIYYCFNIRSGRVEEMEVKQILWPLLHQGYRVLIILTHGGAGYKQEEKTRSMRAWLLTKIREKFPDFPEEDILEVSSCEETTLAGDHLKQFGRQEILQASWRSLGRDIAARLPKFYRENALQKIAGWRERSLIFIVHTKMGWLFNNKDAKHMLQDINLDLSNTFSALDADAARCERAAAAYLASVEKQNGFYQPPAGRPEGKPSLQAAQYNFIGSGLTVKVDFWGGLFKTDKAIRKELTERVEKTYQMILGEVSRRESGYRSCLGKVLTQWFCLVKGK